MNSDDKNRLRGKDENASDIQPKYKGEIYFSNPPKNLNSKPDKPLFKKVNNKHKANMNLLIFLGVVIIASSILTYTAISCVNDVLAIGRSNEIVTVNIPEGATTEDVIKILHEDGLIKQEIFSNIFTNFVNKMKKSDEPQYLNGVYYIKSNIGLEAMLNQFKSSQKTAETVKLVFPEGFTIFQIISKLDEFNVCKAEYLFAAIDETRFNYSFVTDIKANDKRTELLEGYLFPDTYEFFVEENANSVMNRLLANFDSKWSTVNTKRAQALGMTTDQIITIASIIQKEAANADQMPLVSSVLHNRLAKPSVYPALECNSTKDYITRFVKPALGEVKATSFFDAYNTYLAPGLPPGPICNPGTKAIEAALYPVKSDYYYFQHDKLGKMYLAKTLDEQNANTMEVLRVNNK